MKDKLEVTITDLWHISRTALAGISTVPTRYDRMIYVKNQLRDNHPELIDGMMSKHLWFKIEDCVTVY